MDADREDPGQLGNGEVLEMILINDNHFELIGIEVLWYLERNWEFGKVNRRDAEY